jgi:hypothetical protein
MTPKDGVQRTAVEPTDAIAPTEADKADAGEVSSVAARQIQRRESTFRDPVVKPFKPPTPEQVEQARQQRGELSWVEIELVGEDDKPIPGERYRITVPDGRAAEGTLDADGRARVDGFEPGYCTVAFPDLDKDAWEFIESVDVPGGRA